MKCDFNSICLILILHSDKLVANLNDVLKTSNTTFKVKKFEDKFKSDMIDKWQDEFNEIWTTKQLQQRLIELNDKKQKHQQQPQQSDSAKNVW